MVQDELRHTGFRLASERADYRANGPGCVMGTYQSE